MRGGVGFNDWLLSSHLREMKRLYFFISSFLLVIRDLLFRIWDFY